MSEEAIVVPVEEVSEQATPIAIPTENTPEASPKEEAFKMPEKFAGKSAEEIAKSYLELEKFKGSPKEDAPADQVVQETSTGEEAGDDPLQIKEPEAIPFDTAVDTYAQKYLDQNGNFSEADYQEMQDKMGWSRGIVDQYIRGQVLEAQQQQASVTKVLGGEEQTASILKWAGDNLSKEQINTMNIQLKDNPEIGAQMLKLRYEAEVPHSGQTLRGNGAPVNTQDVFHNQQEIVKAMGHPEYNNGGAYDLNIKAKIARSIKAGNIR